VRAVVVQTLMRQERNAAVRSYLFPALSRVAGDSAAAGGIATLDVVPARLQALERLDLDRDVSTVFAQMFALASGGITMISKA